jgi:hypothetical protein
MTNYAVGEIVDITIKGARIARKDSTDRIWFTLGGTGEGWIPVHPGDEASVVVQRVAPAEWPPQAGDLWRDRSGALHFGADHVPDYDDRADCVGIGNGGTRVVLISQGTDSSCAPSADFYRPEVVNQRHGPLTLVYREPVEVSAVAA